jgi:hypothetical protein
MWFYYELVSNSPYEDEMEKNGHPSLKAVLDNIKKPMPLGRKIRLFIRNSASKIISFQNCCGHPGEPGC